MLAAAAVLCVTPIALRSCALAIVATKIADIGAGQGFAPGTGEGVITLGLAVDTDAGQTIDSCEVYLAICKSPAVPLLVSASLPSLSHKNRRHVRTLI